MLERFGKLEYSLLSLPSCNKVKFCFCSKSPTFLKQTGHPLIFVVMYNLPQIRVKWCQDRWAILKRGKNFRPSAVRRPPSDNALRRPTPLRPTDWPTIKNFSWHCLCPTPGVRRPTPIQWGQSYRMFTVSSSLFIMDDRKNQFIILGHNISPHRDLNIELHHTMLMTYQCAIYSLYYGWQEYSIDNVRGTCL